MPALAGRIRRWARSTSTRTAALVGLIFYLSYAFAHGSWANPTLIGVSVFVGLFLPSYAKLSNKAELWANNQFGFVTCGRLGRFVPQYVFNLAAFWIMQWGGALKATGIESVGGVAVAALVTTLASQGAQYGALYVFQRGFGDANRNVLVAVSVNLVLAALGTAGVPGAREAFLASGVVFGALFFGLGLMSDLRSLAAPRGGVGMFFGTFNPFHNTHLEMVRRALEERDLDRIVIHPTLVPRLHADAFRREEIRVARLEQGFQIYEKTEKADVAVDYFPTGNKFLPPETRKALIELALAEAGLSNRVEVAFYPEIYNTKGFQGVIAEIRRRHPGQRLHTLHGTDFGGMLVRQISDECGWIYPWRILRRDRVSATAIRRGATGMTATVVTDVLEQLTANLPVVTAGGRRFRNDNGVLTEGT
ncbi:adenylyltransferase/cytidyltransferase family protein [Reyranella sp.]|uniref:adenylyltransferase/cytidyltransferase family protein n=1 Tax=Reyranella sp. TaxID=1929291 RepID=UPI003BA93908